MRVLSKLLWNGSTNPIKFDSITVIKNEKLQNNKMSVTISLESEVIVNKDIRFNIDDRFTLWAKNDYTGTELDTSNSSPDLIFNGVLKEISFKDDTRFQCKLELVDSTYDLFNRLWGKTYEDTTPNVVKNIVDFGAFTGDGTYIINTPTIDTGFPYTSGIQGKRPDGTDFPTITYGNAHKPIFEFLDDLSQVEYTNNSIELNGNLICKRPFKYYIDRYNVFHWFYPTDTPNYELQYGATGTIGSDTIYHRVLSDNLKLSQFGEVNFIIFKAGEDMGNVQILDYDLDPTAKALTTADGFRNWEHIAREMKLEDSGNITHVKGDEWSYPVSYPVIPKWSSLGSSVGSDSEYNDAFVEEATFRAKAKAKGEFSETGDARWKGSIKIKGEPIESTELIKYNKTKFGFNNLLLRIKSLTHNINKDSFESTLKVEQDVPERT